VKPSQDTCRSCKREVLCEHYTGIGELCSRCAPDFLPASSLIELLHGHSEQDPHLWRSGIRCLQQLEIEYQIVERGGVRLIEIGDFSSRIATLRNLISGQRENLDELMRAHHRLQCCAA